MASCDFSTHPYSYNDNNDSPPDYNQTKFSLAKEDLKYKVFFKVQSCVPTVNEQKC